jgi:hypothetical protein
MSQPFRARRGSESLPHYLTEKGEAAWLDELSINEAPSVTPAKSYGSALRLPRPVVPAGTVYVRSHFHMADAARLNLDPSVEYLLAPDGRLWHKHRGGTFFFRMLWISSTVLKPVLWLLERGPRG